MKKAYYYFCYKIYRFTEKSPSIFPSEVVSAFVVSVLELLVLLSLKGYYFSYFNHEDGPLDPKSAEVILPILIVVGFNGYLLIIKNYWKVYFARFAKISKRKQLLGSVLTVVIIVSIFANFIFSLMKMAETFRNLH
jgi:uncharacterized membrane protein (DUF373 family)